MGEYYGNALCTIAATGAADCAEGLFMERPAQRYPAVSCALPSWTTPEEKVETLHIRPSTRTPLWWDMVVKSPLYRRGWAVQERALSPRILHFTANALYWECSAMRAAEYRPGRLTVAESVAVMQFAKYSRTEVLCWAWDRLVERHCWAKFTYTRDKLLALSGVAKRANAFHPCRYVAGIWAENLIEGLAWHTRFYKAGGPRRPAKYIAPSWSWATGKSPGQYRRIGWATIASWGQDLPQDGREVVRVV
ncbi:hypothetical protein VTI74DRAFT_6754 [Chaetomium olivicolor]